MEPGIKVKMATKQSNLLLMIFFFLVLVSSSTAMSYPEEEQEANLGEAVEGGKLPGKRYSVSHITAIHSGHGGSSGGGGGGGGGGEGGGGRGSSGEGSQGDNSGSREPNGAGAANMNHHRRGASSRVQGSVFLTWVVVIFAAQFLTPLL